MARWLAGLAPVLTLLALAAPAAAATGGCTDHSALHAARTIRLDGASSLDIELREHRAGRLLSLRANGLSLVDAGPRIVVSAGKRRLLSVRVSTRGVRRVRLGLQNAGVRLTVAGRHATARRRLVPETAVRVGAAVAGGRARWTRQCASAKPGAATDAAPGAAVGCAACGAAPGPPAVSDSATLPFAAASVWNTPLAATAPLDPGSAGYVADLRAQLATTVAWINTTSYSAPVYTVPAGRPTVHVKLDVNVPDLQAAFDQVPIPAGALPAAGSDHHLVIWQPSTDRMWEFWLAADQADGWHARWGGEMDGSSLNPGYFVAPHPTWGATATSLPLIAGLIRVGELRQGHIDHALAFALPHARRGVWSWPAQRTDGDVDSAAAIPEGAHLRLDPSLDIDALKLPPLTAMIAKAVQRYGMILRDKAGSLSFYAEDPTQYGTNPYPALFGGYPDNLLAKFPWDRLQVLAMDLHS